MAFVFDINKSNLSFPVPVTAKYGNVFLFIYMFVALKFEVMEMHFMSKVVP